MSRLAAFITAAAANSAQLITAIGGAFAAIVAAVVSLVRSFRTDAAARQAKAESETLRAVADRKVDTDQFDAVTREQARIIDYLREENASIREENAAIRKELAYLRLEVEKCEQDKRAQGTEIVILRNEIAALRESPM